MSNSLTPSQNKQISQHTLFQLRQLLEELEKQAEPEEKTQTKLGDTAIKGHSIEEIQRFASEGYNYATYRDRNKIGCWV